MNVKRFRLSAVLGAWRAEQKRDSYAVTVGASDEGAMVGDTGARPTQVASSNCAARGVDCGSDAEVSVCGVFMLAKDGALVGDDPSRLKFETLGAFTDAVTGKPVANITRYTYDTDDHRYVVTFTRHHDLARVRMIESLNGVKRAAVALLGFDGAYLRFSGEIRVEHYRDGEIVAQHVTDDAILGADVSRACAGVRRPSMNIRRRAPSACRAQQPAGLGSAGRQRMAPAQPGKSTEVAIGGDELGAVLDGQCGDVRVGHQVSARRGCPAQIREDRPVPITGRDRHRARL